MKGKIIGGLIVIVAIAVAVYYFNKKRSDKDEEFFKSEPKKDVSHAAPVSNEVLKNTKRTIEEEAEKVVEIKTSSSETIKERHEEAAQQIKESLENIMSDSKLVTQDSENKGSLDEIDDALDKLLDE